MDFKEYQTEAIKTAIYPAELKGIYPVLGLSGEVGEVSEKIKKLFRDSDGKITPKFREELSKELGDVLWYLANIAKDYDLELENIALLNILKLKDRQQRNVLQGSGDNR